MKEINDSNYEEIIGQNEKLVVIDFTASWCGPCKMLSPIIEQISNEISSDDVIIGKVDVDENIKIVTNYGIRNVPTILFIKKDKIIDKITGAVPKSNILDKINEIL